MNHKEKKAKGFTLEVFRDIYYAKYYCKGVGGNGQRGKKIRSQGKKMKKGKKKGGKFL